MDGEEDDDLYDPADVHQYQQTNDNGVKTEELEEGEEEDEGAEEDSDDEINFITDAKVEPKQEAPQIKRQISMSVAPPTISTPDPRGKPLTPLPGIKQEASLDRKASYGGTDRPGTDYPARHTSTLDVNANPVHPVTGKPIESTDFDTDFPEESSKPWRKPGQDISDYFNYGFDEFTWASYCLKRQQAPKEISEIKGQAESMKAFVEGIGGGGGGGMPGMPPGMPGAPAAPGAAMPGMPGMPSDNEMQQMFAGMMSQGMDPSAMDPNQFMQMMMNGGGPGAGFGGPNPGFGGQPQQQQQQGGFGGGQGGGYGQQGGGYNGRGRGRGRW